MGKIGTGEKQYLETMFGNRVSLRLTERKLYGHDIAALPGMVKPFIGETVPEAVVQPENEDEVIKLVKWARGKGIALTPRGKASSGYGGVLPTKKGLVVDFYRMSRIIKIDPVKMTARVQAGTVWDKLDKELAKSGLTLRLYPSSYPGSTAGGWLAQGGAGIGSFEAGWFRDNVISARVVLPDGNVKEFTGAELNLVSELEGITGLISELTVKVQKTEELEVTATAVPTSDGLQKLLTSIIENDLPIWSILFINPRMAALRNQAPLMEHLGHASEKRVMLPEAYILTLAFRKKDAAKVNAKMADILKQSGAERLPDEIAHHEWENRFKVMLIKRLGPSLVPAEVVIPLDSLKKVLDEIGKKINQPVVKEGIVVRHGRNGKPEVVILGFIPSDQRKPNYSFVFGLSLSIFNIAKKYGGRAYSTGLYFTSRADELLGKARIESIKKFKAEFDPQNLMNPGKVIAGTAASRMVALAGKFDWAIRPMGNKVVAEIGERSAKAVKKIPADVAWYAYSCSQCGYCIDSCTQFEKRGWESQSPRGKWYWLREYMEGNEKWDQAMVDSILACTTCEVCNNKCSVSLPIEQSWMKLRGELIHENGLMTFPPFEMMAAALSKEGDIWAGYRKDRTAWFPADMNEAHGPGKKAKAAYFAGCTASYVEHDIGMATVRLLDAAGIDFAYLGKEESCCGTPMMVAGKWDEFAEVMKNNITAVKKTGADTVITSCPACDMMWRQVYPKWAKKLGINYDITAKHYSEVIADKIRSGEFSFPKADKDTVEETVTWHDSCHMGRVSGIYEPPREMIRALPGVNLVEMASNRECGKCCGSVLTLINEPPVAAELGKSRLDEATAVGAEKVLALCPCCEFQLRVSADKKQLPVEVVDLARFSASKLGFKFPDPNPEVMRQWAVFEAMIALMTPKGFAGLMGTMWPEMIDAMPFGMGHMMRAMGKVPGALDLMKPMFPILFPRLLPMMMPKLMKPMLERVGKMVPMPDYMQEQMPDLMPQVMNNLMPHMIGEVVPLVTQPMIDYLHGKKAAPAAA